MNKLYVGNLSYRATDEDLRSLFSQFGDVDDVKVIMDRQTNRSKGFGFVTLSSADAAKEALRLDGTDHLGRNIKVNIARDKEDRGGDRA